MTRFQQAIRVRAICIFCNLLAACGADTPPPAVEIRTVEVVKEVQRPCPVQKPVKPAPLARPLPTDPIQLAALLALKLGEWAGAGGYGERADSAITLCTKEMNDALPR